MQNFYFIFLILASITNGLGQNLVVDPSFEEVDYNFTTTWKYPSYTPDLFDVRKDTVRWKNLKPTLTPYLGNKYVGLFIEHKNNLESITGTLNQILTKDSLYTIHLYAREVFNKLDKNASFKEPISIGFTSNVLIENKNIPFVIAKQEKEISKVQYNWDVYKGIYKAIGGEKYIILNYPVPINYKRNNIIYDCIDYVSLTHFVPNLDTSILSFPTNQLFRTTAIYFERNKFTIQENSYPYLHQIIEHLTAKPKLQIIIHAHTDDEGNDASNLTLSEQRAQSIADYLVEKGILKQRIVSKGFGETQPVEDNKTAEGRQKNRRVEFILLENL